MSTKTVSVICFSRYGKLLFCNVRNAPRGCALRRTRQMSQAIYVSLRPLLNKRHWRENVPRACLKNYFRNLQAPLCGIFYPHSVAVARYAALIRIKSPTNWDSQLTKSLFQTRSNADERSMKKCKIRSNYSACSNCECTGLLDSYDKKIKEQAWLNTIPHGLKKDLPSWRSH